MLGARDIAGEAGRHVVPGVLEVAGPHGLPLAPRPELALRVLAAAARAGRPGGLRVGGAHPRVVAEVGGVVLDAGAGGRRAEVARGAGGRP